MLQYLYRDNVTVIFKSKFIVILETKLVKAILSKKELRNPKKIYNLYTVKVLSNLTSVIDCSTYFTELDLKNLEKVIINELQYLRTLDEVLRTTSINEVEYFFSHVLNNKANIFSSEL